MGPPGSGKGTQAAKIAEAFGIFHFSTGQAFRYEIERKTELGKIAWSYIEKGNYVPDDFTTRFVDEILAKPKYDKGFLLDGYPRTPVQAEDLDRLLVARGRRLDAILSMHLPAEEIILRLAERLLCEKCGSVYNVRLAPPRTPGRCDRCGEALAARPDDTPEAVRHRIEIDERARAALLSYFRSEKHASTGANGRLLEIDGTGSIEEVFARIHSALASASVPSGAA